MYILYVYYYRWGYKGFQRYYLDSDGDMKSLKIVMDRHINGKELDIVSYEFTLVRDAQTLNLLSLERIINNL
jgi:hypothetical protein